MFIQRRYELHAALRVVTSFDSIFNERIFFEIVRATVVFGILCFTSGEIALAINSALS